MLQAYELQVASGGRWTSVFSTSGNNLQATKFAGPAVLGTALRIRMTRVGCVCGGHFRGPCDWHVWSFVSFASLTPHLATAADMQCKPLSPRGWCVFRHPSLACPASLSKISGFLLARPAPLCKIAPRLKTTPMQETSSSCMQLLPAHVCYFSSPVRNVLPGLPCPSLTHTPRQLQKIMQHSWERRRHISATCWQNSMLPRLLLRLVASKLHC